MNGTIEIMKAFAARAMNESGEHKVVVVELHPEGVKLHALRKSRNLIVGWDKIEGAVSGPALVDWAFACLDQQLPAGHPYKAAQPRKESEHG